VADRVRERRAFVFDVEGTLVDCVPQTLDCWRETLGEFGFSVGREELQRFSGCDGGMMLEALLPHRPKADREDILHRHGELYVIRYLDTVQAFAGVHELFAALHAQGNLLALATTCRRVELQHYNKLLDVERFCGAIECGSNIRRGKPHPDLFSAALDRIGIAASAASAVGDTPYDAIAARACGMCAIGVLTGGFKAAELRGAGCDAVYDSAVQLKAAWSEKAG
jgi:HAD superfamily hydrolase (TIGR01509 family)